MMLAFRRQKQEDQELTVTLSYTENLRLAWATEDLVLPGHLSLYMR